MSDAHGLSEWDRIAALIEECRAEREACASVRGQLAPDDVLDRPIPAGLKERLMGGAGDILGAIVLNDPAS